MLKKCKNHVNRETLKNLDFIHEFQCILVKINQLNTKVIISTRSFSKQSAI